MRKILILLTTVCMLLCLTVFGHAGYGGTSIAIADDMTVEYDRRELLSALYEADIESIRKALDMRLITSRELVEYYLERIDAYNPIFNCFITMCDNALAMADICDAEIEAGTAEGKLHGIPIIVKDNIEYQGYYTTNGQKFSNSEISTTSAKVVKYLLNEGAIIIGKSNMSTSAQDARASRSKAVGETYNAYNTALASGGSSGGSAVGTSLNFGTAALGTDTNSSLRYPAALNGCVSLRATYGLISRTGLIKLNGLRDTAGAITRNVKDQAIMLDIITGGQYDYADNLDENVLVGMRIGILKELTYPVAGKSGRTSKAIDDEIEAAFANAVKELETCGAAVIEVSMPDIFAMADACDEDFENYKTAKADFYVAFKALLEANDITAVIFPTYLTAPLYTGVNEDGSLAIYYQPYTTNCKLLSPTIGLPEISIPIGRHSRGAGIGMEIASLKNSEQLLLNIAYSYMGQYDHREAPDTAPDLYADYNTGSLEEFIVRYETVLAEVERIKAEEQTESESVEATTEATTTETPPETEPTSTTPVETAPTETAPTETTPTETTPTETFPSETALPEPIETSSKVERQETTTMDTQPVSTVVATTTSAFEETESIFDVFANYNAEDDKLGKVLWIVFIMLLLLVAVGNFIILYHEDDNKRRKK